MKALLDGLKTLGPARLGAMGAVALGVLGLLAFLAMRGGTERMALLYDDLDPRESGQAADLLSRQHIAYRVDGQGARILVPEDQVARARVLLAKESLPSGGSIGYEIFDRGDSLMISEFQQRINQARALEGELSRTIRAIQGVRAARVHLVLPRREPFARDKQDAQASVLLTMAGSSRLDREGVQAVLNLVAAAVPGLRPGNISIVDNHGAMLARAGAPADQAGTAASTEEIRRATETRLARAVEEMLEHNVGPGHVRAEASVEMDFDRVNETQERYDPDGQVVRSTQTVNSNSKTTEANSSVSVQNNLPNADTGKDTAGSQEGRQEETTNYEIGHTVRTLIHEQPRIRRVSLAVMVDGNESTGPDGKPVWTPRSAEEIAQMTNLVRGAIGFSEQRGDHVEIASLRFADVDDAPPAPPAGLFGVAFEHADLVRLAQTALLGIVGVLALLFVLRPMVLRLTAIDPALTLEDVSAAIPGPAARGARSGAPGELAGPSAPQAAGLLEDESLVNLSNVDGKLRASSIRRIAELVEKHPEASLSIVRDWMLQEAS